MKSLFFIKCIIVIFICICLKETIQKGGLKDPKPKTELPDLSSVDIDKLSEKDLDALLKDPSNRSIKINPKAELKKPKAKKSKYSDSYKEHLESLNKEGLNVDDSLNLDDIGKEDYSKNPHNTKESKIILVILTY